MTTTDPSDRLVTVCAECLRASCWHGEFLCDRAANANLVDRTVAELDALGYEHPSHYSLEKVIAICGEDYARRYRAAIKSGAPDS